MLLTRATGKVPVSLFVVVLSPRNNISNISCVRVDSGDSCSRYVVDLYVWGVHFRVELADGHAPLRARYFRVGILESSANVVGGGKSS